MTRWLVALLLGGTFAGEFQVAAQAAALPLTRTPALAAASVQPAAPERCVIEPSSPRKLEVATERCADVPRFLLLWRETDDYEALEEGADGGEAGPPWWEYASTGSLRRVK